MKKLFGRDKPKPTRGISSKDIAAGVQLPDSHNPRNAQLPRESSSDDNWEVVGTPDGTMQPPRPPALSGSRTTSVASLPPGASPPVPNPLAPPRAASPFGGSAHGGVNGTPKTSNAPRDLARDGQNSRKRQPAPAVGGGLAALGILRALDPQNPIPDSISTHSEEFVAPSEVSYREEKKEKKSFWGAKDKERDRLEKEKERWRERDREDSQAELTRMIGYLTATASEDWALVLEVCERASSSDASAKEAVRALRREFKYAEPSAQLSAARLWAIMLRNSSDVFISQTLSRKFLDTIEDLLTSSRTSPVVKERLLDVVAAAAYASGSKSKDARNDKEGFRGLWRRVKPVGAPDDGIPFDTDDAMFNPPQSSPTRDHVPVTARRKSSPSRNRIIPPDEDMRRLFQECKIGQGNAALLSEALTFARPEDLMEKEIIREFYAKCRASQELIYAQIPWASAGAERSRIASGRDRQTPPSRRNNSSPGAGDTDDSNIELTMEEQLLAALLGANEELLEALRTYSDLERIAVEKEAEEMSRQDFTGDPAIYAGNEYLAPRLGGASSSRSPSPSTSPPSTHPLPRVPPSLVPSHEANASNPNLSSQAAQLAALAQSLAPPPPAPHGPRSPAQLSLSSRTPSPTSLGHSRSNSLEDFQDDLDHGLGELHLSQNAASDAGHAPILSEKALGKRKAVDADQPTLQPSSNDDDLFEHFEEPFAPPENDQDSEVDEHDPRWRQPIKYVFDAQAEMTQQRIREGQRLVNGVH